MTGRDLGRATWVRITRIVRLPHSVEDVALANRLTALRAVWSPESIRARHSNNADVLPGSGAALFFTNVIMFGICYWELDLGGPSAHAGVDERHPMRTYPDFLCPPRPTAPPRRPRNGSPGFPDYLYVSFTNVVGALPHRHDAADPTRKGDDGHTITDRKLAGVQQRWQTAQSGDAA